MAEKNAHLEVSGLTKRFGGLVAVRDMAFTVDAGKILGLIGPNGSGKSTVMKLIMGIERPDAGSVRINGVEVAGWPSHKVARMGAGIVFQHSRPLHRQTVLENIKLALLPDKLTRLLADPETDTKARAIAARVGLSAVLDRRPATLPFADLRKIEIAKAIARDPQVLLIDEPFAGLTSKETAAFSDLICELRDDGRAVLLVDHNVKSVARLVDRVLAMYVGERIAEGSADEVMRNETVRRVYLGGSIETAARPESSFRDSTTPFLEVKNYAGDIRREGASLRGFTAATIARKGIVQCPEGRELFVDMTVRENLDLGGQHLPPAEGAQQIAWLFDLFPILRDRQKQAAGTLSGGEQQMLTIARALMMKPKLLILDEPTLGLAPVILEQLSKALERLRQTTPITVLLGEQNVTFALPHADRVYVLEHARIVWEGEPARFAADVGTGYL